MRQLILWLMPYTMVIGGLFLMLGFLPTILSGGEESPTPVAIEELTVDVPKARWVKVAGGGLYLPGAIVDERIDKTTQAKKPKAWYVPYISQQEALARAKWLVDQAELPTIKKVVLVRFSPDEYLRSYPAPEHLKAEDVFRLVDVEGTRSSNVLFPERLKDFIHAELKLPLEGVVVINFGDKPIQGDEAVTMTVILAAIALVGVIWIFMRFRRPSRVQLQQDEGLNSA